MPIRLLFSLVDIRVRASYSAVRRGAVAVVALIARGHDSPAATAVKSSVWLSLLVPPSVRGRVAALGGATMIRLVSRSIRPVLMPTSINVLLEAWDEAVITRRLKVVLTPWGSPLVVSDTLLAPGTWHVPITVAWIRTVPCVCFLCIVAGLIIALWSVSTQLRRARAVSMIRIVFTRAWRRP